MYNQCMCVCMCAGVQARTSEATNENVEKLCNGFLGGAPNLELRRLPQTRTFEHGGGVAMARC